MIEIMYSDLTLEKQQEIAEELGYTTPEECSRDRNWSIFPLITLEFEEDDCDCEEDDCDCEEDGIDPDQTDDFIDYDQQELNELDVLDESILHIDDFIPSE